MLPVSSVWLSPGRARTSTTAGCCAPAALTEGKVTSILIVRGFSRVRAIHQAVAIRAQHHVLHHEVPWRQEARIASRCIYGMQVWPIVSLSQEDQFVVCHPEQWFILIEV